MRVVHIGKFYPPVRGGMESILQTLCEGECRCVDSRVLVANDCPVTVHEEIRGVRVTRVASYGRVQSVAVCPTFPAWLQRQAADIMVIHEPNTLGMLSHFLIRPPSKLVVWFHSEVVRQRRLYALHRPFLRRALRRADRVIVSSPPLAQQASELKDFHNKCVVIPYGIEPSRLQCTPDIATQVAQLRRRYRQPMCLFVGRMVSYKGIETFIRALPGFPGTAVLAGDGPLLSSMKHLATTLGLENRVFFTGEASTEDIIALYHACDIFVLPSVSRNEAFGIVQIEAMACKKPVVSTDLQGSGVPWVNRHEETGLIVPPGDVAALHRALRHLASAPVLRARLGALGQKRVMAEFTSERMVQRTAEVYKDLMSSIPRFQGAPTV